MEGSGLGGGFLSCPNGVLIDLESPIHGNQPTHLRGSSLTRQHTLNIMNDSGNGQNSIGLMELNGLTLKRLSMNFNNGKTTASVNPMNDYTSEEDEPSYVEDKNGENRLGSQWQRMKWTDDVIRLLIAMAAHVGDDGEGWEGLKRKTGILQKKGKWKMVSKLMISKGCYVSPQQCEDKFNDLNKRYKRLNDILGRGTSCRVVENPTLMDSMLHLSTKAKDDVRKILSSKHLFYKEMCAYHNGQKIPNSQDLYLQNCSLPIGAGCRENNSSEKEDVDNNSDDESDDDKYDHDREREKVAEEFFHEPATTSLWERKEWIKKQMFQLQEQRVSLQVEAFELEKQRLKWLRYCSKKGRELERLRLENERMRLENELRILELKKKDMKLEFQGI